MSAQYLKNIHFLDFSNKHDSSLRFDASQFAKNKRSMYSININKRSTYPFDLIHSNIVMLLVHLFMVINTMCLLLMTQLG